jgi:hypothetical protein
VNIQIAFHKIKYFLQTTSTQTLIVIPFLIGMCCFGIIVITDGTYTGKPSQNILILLGFLCWAIAGIPKIIRQESVYGPIHLYGPLAIVDGVFNILACLALASIPIIVWNR